MTAMSHHQKTGWESVLQVYANTQEAPLILNCSTATELALRWSRRKPLVTRNHICSRETAMKRTLWVWPNFVQHTELTYLPGVPEIQTLTMQNSSPGSRNMWQGASRAPDWREVFQKRKQLDSATVQRYSLAPTYTGCFSDYTKFVSSWKDRRTDMSLQYQLSAKLHQRISKLASKSVMPFIPN